MNYQVHAVFFLWQEIHDVSSLKLISGDTVEVGDMERVSRTRAQMANFPTFQLSLRLPGPGVPRKLLLSIIQTCGSVAPPQAGPLSWLISVQPQFLGKSDAWVPQSRAPSAPTHPPLVDSGKGNRFRSLVKSHAFQIYFYVVKFYFKLAFI